MRKGLFFWGVLAIVGIILIGGFYYLGKKPAVLDPVDAIPKVETEHPWLLLAASGDQINLLQWPEDEDSSSVEALARDIWALSSLSDKVAIWAELPYVEHWYGAFKLSKEEIDTLAMFKVPDRWKAHLPHAAVSELPGDALQIKLSRNGGSFVGKIKKGILLVSQDADGLSKMLEAVDAPSKRVKLEWSVNPQLPAHLIFFDGGLLARKIKEGLKLEGQSGKAESLTVTFGWEASPSSGDIFWNVEGLEKLLATSEGSGVMLKPVEWDKELFLPNPLVVAFGFNLKGITGNLLEEEFEEAIPVLSDRNEDFGKLLDGEVLVMVGGKARLALLSLPGILLQLPERGEDGLRMVEELWETYWLEPKPMEGFTTGGNVAFPLTLIGAANEKLVLIGAIDQSTLLKRKGLSEVLGYDKPALGWLYIDFPKAAEALEDLEKISDFSNKMGVVDAPDLKDIRKLIYRFKQLGKFRMIFYDAKSGEAHLEMGD